MLSLDRTSILTTSSFLIARLNNPKTLLALTRLSIFAIFIFEFILFIKIDGVVAVDCVKS